MTEERMAKLFDEEENNKNRILYGEKKYQISQIIK